MKNNKRNLVLCGLSFAITFFVFIEDGNARVRGRASKVSTPVIEEKIETPKVEVDKVKELIGIPNYLLTSENCDLFYTMCMNKFCIQDDVKGACSCTPSALKMSQGNGVDKFYDINGDMVKEGVELLQYSEGFCSAVLERCSGMELGIKNSYNITSQSDCVAWAVENPEVEPTIYDEFIALKNCMKPVCAGDGKLPNDVPFVKCFNLDEANILLNECSHIIASSANNLSLKEYFVKSMKVEMQEMCKNLNHASTAEDQYGCDVMVSYGVTSEKPIKEMVFKMGDSIMCSQEYFGTETPIVKSIAKANARKMKYRAIADTAAAGVNMVAAVANVATPPGGEGAISEAALKGLETAAIISGAAGAATGVAALAASRSDNEKLKTTVGDVNGVVGGVAGGLGAGGLGSALTSTAGAVSAVGDVVAQAGAITAGAADIVKYNAQQKLSVEVRAKGSCWVKGQMVAQEGQVLTLMWNDFYKY